MRPFLIVIIIVLFIFAMDLYALRGIQYLFSPGRNGSSLFFYVYWGLSFLMAVALILTGSRFQQLRDPSRFFGIMLIMGIFLMIYLPKVLFNATQLLGDVAMLFQQAVPGGQSRPEKMVPPPGFHPGPYHLCRFWIRNGQRANPHPGTPGNI